MAEFRLTSRPALGGREERIGATTLREIDGAGLTTISIPLGAEAAMQAAVRDNLGCTLPAVGAAATSPTTGTHVLRPAADRLMRLCLPGAAAPRPPELPGYFVDQSDAWVLLDLAGPLCVAALERSCRLDLDLAAFGPDRIARTPIEAVSVILYRRAADRFLLLAPRSYAAVLMHTLCTSLRYVV